MNDNYHPSTEFSIIEAMEKNFRDHFLNGSDIVLFEKSTKKNNILLFFYKIKTAIKTMSNKKYWTKANLVEAWGFGTKIAIIFPGLLFGHQWWWIYIFALASSIALIWSSTVKTLPTIILFNVLWIILASLSILKHFWWF